MKQTLFFGTIAILLTATTLKADPILDISFENDASLDQFESPGEGLTFEKDGEKSGYLSFDAKTGDQKMKPVPVASLRKYKLSIIGAVDSADTIEANDRIPEIIAANRGRGFARCELEFFDSEGNEATFLIYGRIPRRVDSIHFVSREMQKYVTVFYAPPQAETLRLTLGPKNRGLKLKKLVLESETAEDSVNCNPDFRYGPLNLSGWNPDTEGRLYLRPDGTTVLKCGYGAGSSMFAVDEETRYSFFCKGESYASTGGKVTVSFFDIAGNELGNTHLFWGKDMEDGATKSKIQPLPGSKLAQIKASRVILQEVKVTED